MIDIIGKLKLNHIPEYIYNDNISTQVDLSSDSGLAQDVQSVQSFINHLNRIIDWQEKKKSLEWLENDFRKNFNNPVYTTTSENLINSIATIGGTGSEVDFILILDAIEIVLRSYEQMALCSVTGVNKP